jgi:hypothetical protein
MFVSPFVQGGIPPPLRTARQAAAGQTCPQCEIACAAFFGALWQGRPSKKDSRSLELQTAHNPIRQGLELR